MLQSIRLVKLNSVWQTFIEIVSTTPSFCARCWGWSKEENNSTPYPHGISRTAHKRQLWGTQLYQENVREDDIQEDRWIEIIEVAGNRVNKTINIKGIVGEECNLKIKWDQKLKVLIVTWKK